MAAFDDLQIELSAPRLLRVITVAVHVLAAALLCTLQPPWLAWVGMPWVLASAVWETSRLTRMPRRLRHAGAGPAGGGDWLVGDNWRGDLLDVPCAARWLIVMRLCAAHDGSRRLVVMAGDQLGDADARRLLRVLRRGAR